MAEVRRPLRWRPPSARPAASAFSRRGTGATARCATTSGRYARKPARRSGSTSSPRPRRASIREVLAAYAETLRDEAQRLGVALGEPRFDDDGWHDKLSLRSPSALRSSDVAFGCPPRADVARLQAAGIDVCVMITDPEGGPRGRRGRGRCTRGAGRRGRRAPGSFLKRGRCRGHRAARAAPARRARLLDRPGRRGRYRRRPAVAAVLCAGAVAAQLGTAFMLAPEAGASNAHRAALAEHAPTRITRAFSGRRARGIVNRFMREHEEAAPVGYPELHHLTAPVRAAARAADDPSAINLLGRPGIRAERGAARGIVRRPTPTRLADHSRHRAPNEARGDA